MFGAFYYPSSGTYQLQQQPLVYRRNVVVAVLLVVVWPTGPTTTNSTADDGHSNAQNMLSSVCTTKQ
jgi:hypothetical protein